MGRYALNLPSQLKREEEQLASEQGLSLNRFILWAVSEKVGSLKQQLDDPAYPQITYRRAAPSRSCPAAEQVRRLERRFAGGYFFTNV